MSPISRAPRTLADELRRHADEALAALFRARPDLGIPTPSDMTQVASRAVTRASVTHALDHLDSGQLHVLESLMVAPRPATIASVRTLTNAPRPYVDAAIVRLRELALVWGLQRDLHVVRTVYDVLGPQPAGLGSPAVRIDPANIGALLTEARERAPEADAVLERLTWGPPTGRLGRSLPAVDALIELGLLASTDEQTVALPREVALHLRGGKTTRRRIDEPPPVSTVDVDPNRVTSSGAGTALELVRRIDELLDRWSAAPPSVLRSGGMGVRDVREEAIRLGVEAAEASLLIELAKLAGLLDRTEDRDLGEVWVPTLVYDAWRDEPTAKQWARIVRAWLTTDRCASLAGSRDQHGRIVNTLAYDLERPLAPSVRRTTLEVVGELAPLGYADEADVIAQVEWHRPRRGELRDQLARATLSEAQVLGVLAGGSLTDWGRELLDGGDGTNTLAPVLPEPVHHLMIQADLTAVAPGPLARSVATTVSEVAEIESRGGATVFRFTSGSIRRALDSGWPADRIHRLVRDLSATPVPQPLTYLIDDVARRHGRLRIGNASVYVRSDDPAELDALLAAPAVTSLRLRRIAPTVALSDAPADIVLGRIGSTGLPPVVEALDGSLHVPTTEPRRSRARPTEHSHRHAHPTDEQVEALVTAIRAGDQAAARRPERSEQDDRSSARTLALLRDAVENGTTVWLAYLDQAGAPSERIVDPIRVDAGWLTAYDHRSDRRQSFAIHRIGQVSARR